MNTSFIISSKDRARYFPKTWESIEQYFRDGDELVIVEDSEKDWSGYLKTLGVPFQFYKTGNKEYRNGVFSKNIALRRAKNEVICINDPEVIHLTAFYVDMLKMIEENPMLFLVPSTLYSQKYTDCPLQDCSVIENQMAPFVGVTMKKNLFDVGGWDERFIYWGNDDNDLMNRLGTIGVKHQLVQGKILHQFHPRPPQFAMGDCNHQFLYEENKNPVANEGKEWGVL